MAHRLTCLMRSLANSRHMPVILAVMAVVVMLPALGHGWFLDDMIFRAKFLASSGTGNEMEEVGFRGGRTRSAAYRSGGPLPASRCGSIISSIPTARRCIIFTVFCGLGGRYSFWRSCIGGWAVRFGWRVWRVCCMFWMRAAYVLDESSYFPVAFVANRNAVIALFFGLLAVLMHDKWRREGSVGGAVLSCVFLALSLLSAEAGIAAAAYIGAYALVFERGKWSRRIVSLVPAVGVVVVWRVVHAALGYATCASGVYIDPGAEPLRFTAAALERGPILVYAQLLGSAADAYYVFSDPARVKVLAAVVAILAVLLAVLRPVLRADRVARFWFLGMLFAVVPICATMASNRNLLFVAVGGMGVVAHFIGWMLSGEERPAGRRLWRMAGWVFFGVFLFVHVVCAAGVRVVAPLMYSKWETMTELTFDIDLPDDISNRDVVCGEFACSSVSCRPAVQDFFGWSRDTAVAPCAGACVFSAQGYADRG